MSKTTHLTLLILLTFINKGMTQRFGMEAAFATSKAVGLQLLYNKDNNNFKLGGTFQLSNARGKFVDKQLSNYGRTTDGGGKYFATFDLGYGKIIKDKFIIDGEVSIGTMSHFTNYLDNRFNGGGYHMVTRKETVAGLGVNVGYSFDRNFSIYTGFNTVRKLQFGIRYVL